MKIYPVGAELFHVATRTDRHDEGNGRVSQLCEGTLKNGDMSFIGMKSVRTSNSSRVTEGATVIPTNVKRKSRSPCAFLDAFAALRKAKTQLRYVSPFSWNKSTPTGRHQVKFDI